MLFCRERLFQQFQRDFSQVASLIDCTLMKAQGLARAGFELDDGHVSLGVESAIYSALEFMKEHRIKTKEKREKNWKLLYLRSEKLARAKQLGIDYPHPSNKHEIEDNQPLNVLFICSRNQWRSPTAEAVWRNHPDLRVRSAGTSPRARRHVSADDIRWAHSIFVMENKHRSRLQAEFGRVIASKPVHVLDIPDEYQYMDPELVDLLQASVGSILGLP